MNTVYNLTDRFGPRLLNSPQFRQGRRLGSVPTEGVGPEQCSPGEVGGGHSRLEEYTLRGQHGGTCVSAAIGVPVAWTSGTTAW